MHRGSAMLSIQYDGTFDGFLSGVFEIYRQKLDVGEFVPERAYESDDAQSMQLFSQLFHVETNFDNACRLKRAIVKASSENVLNLLQAAFRSESAGIEMLLFAYLRKLFLGLPNYGKDVTSPEMLPLFKIAKSVLGEMHNLLGMVRFNKAPDGSYIAEIEPKYNVVDMLKGHFCSRMRNLRWAILDVKRGHGVFYDGCRATDVEIPADGSVSRHLHNVAPPDEFTRMWKSYYDAMAIKERLNPKLLKRCLPVRYWKHLPERSGIPGNLQSR